MFLAGFAVKTGWSLENLSNRSERNAVIHFHGFIPIVAVRLSIFENHCPSILLDIRRICRQSTDCIPPFKGLSALALQKACWEYNKKIIVAFVFHRSVVVRTKIRLRLPDCFFLIFSGNVVGNDIDNHLQSRFVASGNQGFEFLQTIGWIHGQIGIDIVIILYGIRLTGTPFYHFGVVV